MTELKILIDNVKFDYNGPFVLSDLFKLITNFMHEQGYDMYYDKNSELNTDKGKSIEWQISPNKKITEETRYIIRIRIVAHNIVKVQAMHDKKKVKIDKGHIEIYFDGFIGQDANNKWGQVPLFMFIRTLVTKFVFKTYTERFEQRFAHDFNRLYDYIQKFFNTYHKYSVISKIPH